MHDTYGTRIYLIQGDGIYDSCGKIAKLIAMNIKEGEKT